MTQPQVVDCGSCCYVSVAQRFILCAGGSEQREWAEMAAITTAMVALAGSGWVARLAVQVAIGCARQGPRLMREGASELPEGLARIVR